MHWLDGKVWKQAEARGCLVHHVHWLRLVVAHVDGGLVDAQRATRERLAELSGEGEGGKLVRREARCEMASWGSSGRGLG